MPRLRALPHEHHAVGAGARHQPRLLHPADGWTGGHLALAHGCSFRAGPGLSRYHRWTASGRSPFCYRRPRRSLACDRGAPSAGSARSPAVVPTVPALCTTQPSPARTAKGLSPSLEMDSLGTTCPGRPAGSRTAGPADDTSSSVAGDSSPIRRSLMLCGTAGAGAGQAPTYPAPIRVPC